MLCCLYYVTAILSDYLTKYLALKIPEKYKQVKTMDTATITKGVRDTALGEPM